MAFRDLDEFLVVEPLELPIRGKLYSFPGEVSARTWLLMQSLAEKVQRAIEGEDVDPNEELADDATEEQLRAELMGPTLGEMIEDGLTSSHLKAVQYTLIAFHLSGREAAEKVWEAQGKAPTPSREERRHPATAKSPRPRGSRALSSSQSTKAAPAGETS